MAKAYHEKVILFWCKCPPVYDDNGDQILSQYPSGMKDTDENFDPVLDICDVCNTKNKKKKLVKYIKENEKIISKTTEDINE